MLVLIMYDVNTSTKAGQGRLRKISKLCVDYGQCVQNSVFECSLDWGQYKKLQHDLVFLMDKGEDSLRFYVLGNNYKGKIEHFGVKVSYMPAEPLIF